MSKLQRHVLLVDGNPLVLEGMKLLLQDMHCDVTIVRHQQVKQSVVTANIECPQLIIAPKVLESGVSGERLIHEVRAHYKTNIPAILLGADHGFNTESGRQDNIVILSDGPNPQRLRKVITEFLNQDRLAKHPT